ncbi:hypothetical protein Afil01_45930 [Actinorhabdospora filicis]|uniref:Amidohydrolase-related domain-containing protein n=1 Tax=Actinorhabdospora filicis TaxID=1785913 RepID=A0A9W6SPH2_9ACTN|nr:hypothetical protein Afil01_45930 [Actinorhabdospora filicis]
MVLVASRGQDTAALLAAGAEDAVAGIVADADVRGAGLASTLDRYAQLPGAAKLRGVRHDLRHDGDPGECSGPETIRGLRTLAERGLTFDLAVRTEQMPYAAKLAAAVEETLFVLDHMGEPSPDGFAAWREALAPLAAQPHVVAKLTWPVDWTVAVARPFFEHAVAAFGDERLMWGSRGPEGDARAAFALADELLDEFAPTGRRRILGGTAAEVYGLE